MSKNDDKRYIVRLLKHVNNGGAWISEVSGMAVSASAIDRFETGTPLNKSEMEFMNTDQSELFARVDEMVDELVKAGITEYAMNGLFSVLRYKADIGGQKLSMNDHGAPIMSRIYSERGCGILFHCRPVVGETLKYIVTP